MQTLMYTTDGLWFNLIWHDGLFILLAIIYIIVGPIRIRKKKKDGKVFLFLGIIVLIFFIPMFINDYIEIVTEDFAVSTGKIHHWHSVSGARGIGFVYEYSFDTNEHDKFQSYLLNATTMRKHLGGGFEFDKDRTYVITYEENSRFIVGIVRAPRKNRRQSPDLQPYTQIAYAHCVCDKNIIISEITSRRARRGALDGGMRFFATQIFPKPLPFCATYSIIAPVMPPATPLIACCGEEGW